MCIVGESCPVQVVKAFFQESEDLVNGRGNYDYAKVDSS